MTVTPSGRGPELIAVYAFFGSLATVFVALRTYCRAFMLGNLGLDDYFALVSCVGLPQLAECSQIVV